MTVNSQTIWTSFYGSNARKVSRIYEREKMGTTTWNAYDIHSVLRVPPHGLLFEKSSGFCSKGAAQILRNFFWQFWWKMHSVNAVSLCYVVIFECFQVICFANFRFIIFNGCFTPFEILAHIQSPPFRPPYSTFTHLIFSPPHSPHESLARESGCSEPEKLTNGKIFLQQFYIRLIAP